MIDIHSHIVFGVDDGPSTIEESLALLKEAFSQGVRTIVSTSHRRKNMFETPEDTIMTNFKEVQALAKKELPDLTLLELKYTSPKMLLTNWKASRFLL